MAMPEFLKKILAGITGSTYESPAPLSGMVEQRTRYSGDKPSQFSVRGETTDMNHPFSVTTADARDKILAASGTHMVLSTGGGNDTVYAGNGEEPLSYSTVRLGAGNDEFIPGFQSDNHFQHNHIYGDSGRDVIRLESAETFELRGEIWGENQADGSQLNKTKLVGKDDQGWGQHYTFEDFEYLRFETQDKNGQPQLHTFPLEEVLKLETGYNDGKSIMFNPDTQKLEITYESPEKGKTTLTLTSLEERAADCETQEILPPGNTPDGATPSKERCR